MTVSKENRVNDDERNQDLAGKIAVVTGGASGIGSAIVECLVARGADVVVGDRTPGPAETPEHVAFVECDLAVESGAETLVSAAVKMHGRVDILVNNVGIFPYRQGFLTVTRSDWMQILNTNFFSMVECCRAAIPFMQRDGGGSIISIASDLASQPDPFLVDYAVSKTAILSLSKSLSAEFGPFGIRSNVVSPGPTVTPQWLQPGGFAESLSTEYHLPVDEAIRHFAREVRKLPLGELLEPVDIGRVVAFLASDNARHVTGSEWCVDSGVRRAI